MGKTTKVSSKLGFFSLFSVAIGLIIAQSGFVPLLQTAAISESGFIIALGCAYLLALTYVMSFSELALMFPRAGGLATYTEAAIGNLPAIVAVFSAYVIPPMLGIGAEIFLLDTLMNELYPGAFSPLFLGYMTLATFAIMNCFGIDMFARLQSLIVIVMILAISFLAYSALTTTTPVEGSLNITDFSNFNPMGLGVFSVIALSIWCMVGAEFVCPLVEEAEKPNRDIPKSMLIGLSFIFVLYLILGYSALHVLPAQQILESTAPHALLAKTVFGEGSSALIAAIAITACASSVNAVMASIPHMLYGMAKNRQVFPQFKKLNKYGAPWVGILFLSLSISVPLAFMQSEIDSIMLLLIAASVSWFIAYIIAHINVIVLRCRKPEISRPFKTPFYPLPQVLGIVGFAYIAINCSPTPEMSLQVYSITGTLLLLITVIGALWVKFHMKEEFFKPVSVPTTSSSVSHD
nr:APC family permease [Pseudocolwellia agarivorans]